MEIEEKRKFMRHKIYFWYFRGLYYILVTLSSVGYGDEVSMPDESYYNSESTSDFELIGLYWADDVFMFSIYMCLNMCAFAYFSGRISQAITIFLQENS